MFWTVFAQLHMFHCKCVFIAPDFLLMRCYCSSEITCIQILWGYFFSSWHAVANGDHVTLCQNSPLLLFLEHKCKPAPNGCVSAKVPLGDDSSFSPVGKAAGRLDGKCRCWNGYQFCFAGQSLACRASWRVTFKYISKNCWVWRRASWYVTLCFILFFFNLG